MTELRELIISEPIDPRSGGVEVSMQDQTTPTIDSFMLENRHVGPYTTITTSAVVVGDTTINVGLTTAITDFGTTPPGDTLFIADDSQDSFWECRVMAKTATTLTVDVPAPAPYPIGTNVFHVYDDFMQGTTAATIASPRIFGVNNNTSVREFDITRVILMLYCSSGVTAINNFANANEPLGNTATEGPMLLRHWVSAQTHYHNLAYWYSNADVMSSMFDFDILSGLGAGFTDGFKARMTFGGTAKHGVVIRLEPGDRLEMVIQDDLATLGGAGSITSFKVMVQGHQTSD
jgi:hypothetical protein